MLDHSTHRHYFLIGAFKLELKHHPAVSVLSMRWGKHRRHQKSLSLIWTIEMDAMQYAEGVVKEFLLFRGFTHTLQSFESELHADVGNGFQVHTSTTHLSLTWLITNQNEEPHKLGLVFLCPRKKSPRTHSRFPQNYTLRFWPILGQ